MNKPKIALFSDGQGWIVDRLAIKHIELLSNYFDFDLIHYTRCNSNDLVRASEEHDMIHYFNWDIGRHSDALPELKCPLVMSIRSHRYHSYVPEVVEKYVTKAHVVNPMLQKEFPGSVYIPDPIFDDLLPQKEFTVGFAGQRGDYKGTDIIEEACRIAGVKYLPAYGSIAPENMSKYYDSVDLMVIASIAEGNNTIAMECLAMNKPFLTTRVGIPSTLNLPDCFFVDRTSQSIADGILRHYTRPKVIPEYTWESIIPKFRELYNNVYAKT